MDSDDSFIACEIHKKINLIRKKETMKLKFYEWFFRFVAFKASQTRAAKQKQNLRYEYVNDFFFTSNSRNRIGH